MITSLPEIRTLPRPVLTPKPGTPWADTMVLNPAVLEDPSGSGRLHMLFRATGPWPEAQQPGKPLPYPIFLGYATSNDGGKTWDADFSRPCLAPRLATKVEDLFVTTRDGRRIVDYANGCIEDPRLIRLDGKLYLTAACRLCPPGPYWENHNVLGCPREWGQVPELGRAGRDNLTVTTLYEVDLDALKARDYDRAFAYLGPLTDPERGDNRDAFLFPERIVIDGKPRVVSLHRPMEPAKFDPSLSNAQPPIFLAAADDVLSLATDKAKHRLLASAIFPWEGNRVGGELAADFAGSGRVAPALPREAGRRRRLHPVVHDPAPGQRRLAGGRAPLPRPADVREAGVGAVGQVHDAVRVHLRRDRAGRRAPDELRRRRHGRGRGVGELRRAGRARAEVRRAGQTASRGLTGRELP